MRVSKTVTLEMKLLQALLEQARWKKRSLSEQINISVEMGLLQEHETDEREEKERESEMEKILQARKVEE